MTIPPIPAELLRSRTSAAPCAAGCAGRHCGGRHPKAEPVERPRGLVALMGRTSATTERRAVDHDVAQLRAALR